MAKTKKNLDISDALFGLLFGLILMIVVFLFAHHVLGLEYFPA
ncbi:hypothetical protein AJ85_19545 [Alkalihalobacillus alcalophilus ATCC 27647 = CGMCC 1.3604]|uniref:Uncharacterized protein n=1 Tax=Alkalihalobacillus alcalophilus ATCC 27647 = CGMCC 1.3604 TaxID=1218173 RepID=A0A4V3X868_ALKAL|nr:hypothetical protein [Alkalihalobacillus alcalophilus]MED1560886.1 hypothetical protein [Alkalihalobacillus alcalophilus]THG89102.1 hypothetical protein AJ85_19545 [Alkalihalobacillus alcalophilus ATCC 27647 = CGMCC 1.3604]